MSSNKNIKKELIRIYGKGCMFDRARIAKRIEEMGGIRTFKKFLAEKKFKRQKISYDLTVHHLVHRSEGGADTAENCTNIAEVAHQYLHSLPRDQEEIINNMLREFKVNCVAATGMKEITNSLSYTIDENTEFFTIPTFDINQEMKNKRLKHPSRAERKRMDRKIIEEEEDYDK